jgi:hypothetical protein
MYNVITVSPVKEQFLRQTNTTPTDGRNRLYNIKSDPYSFKDAFILVGRRSGATATEIGRIISLNTSNVSRRSDAARLKALNDADFGSTIEKISREYKAKIATSQA